MDQIELKRGADHRAIEIPRERGQSYEAAFSGARAVLDEWERDGPQLAVAAPEPELVSAGKKGGESAGVKRSAKRSPKRKR